MNKIIIAALTLGYLALGASMHYQQEALQTLLNTQYALVQDYAALSSDIQKLRRENLILPERVEKIEYQMDLVTAATRSGWKQAYRLVQAGVFE